ncbi:UNVERIFIED_CONTAM: hypothetical protein GTU68_019746 [Idotea baltica]|nr:hypothetical protein [Idotea baltica]
MGSRKLKRWIVLPLKDALAIRDRHSIVDYLVSNESARENWKDELEKIHDLERLISKISVGKAAPREILQLKNSLLIIPTLKKLLTESQLEILMAKADILQSCDALVDKLTKVMHDEPPSMVSKGGTIKTGFNAELDELRHIIDHAQDLLVNIQVTEAEQTGIASLKIGFNNVFGYYLEVTNKYKNQGLIPGHWVRKQTLTNAERYITEELKVLEEKILGAKDKAIVLEEQIYEELMHFTQGYIQPIQENARLIAETDCLLSFAILAERQNYVRPEMTDGYALDIKQGRHPVIEQQITLGESYIPNDVFLDRDEQQVLMITGPNMSGKSAILRQTALISLLAQMGSFVPARSAKLSILDRIFTRVGASDNISSGESTFMVEMNETASIMNNISDRSLILLDEIGRGTSTYDGISIAWSIAEFLHENKMARPKTLFATHYHELNTLAEQYPRIKNYHVATKETSDQVIFLRTLKPGGTKHSFGIHVAKMAGMPQQILDRANNILITLETNALGQNASYQMQIFDVKDQAAKKIRSYMDTVDPHRITPIEAMLKLQELKDMLNRE